MKYTIELTENQKKQMDFMLDMANKHMGFNRKLEMIETTNVEDTNEYQIGYNVGFKDGAKARDEVQYRNALEDVNHAMTVLENMTDTEREEWFEDYASVGEIIREFTIQRIIKSTKAYEEKKKAEDEIKVGDEIKSVYTGILGVVTGVSSITSRLRVLYHDGSGMTMELGTRNFKKTGRHFDEVEQLLNKLRGKEEQ